MYLVLVLAGVDVIGAVFEFDIDVIDLVGVFFAEAADFVSWVVGDLDRSDFLSPMLISAADFVDVFFALVNSVVF